MIYVTIAGLYKKSDCGFDVKQIVGCTTNASSQEDARRGFIAHTDVVKSVLDGWLLANISAHEIKPEELLTDDDLIKAFVIEMARRPKESDDAK